MNAKHHYDRKHQPLFMKKDGYALIRLHHGYQIPANDVLGKKYGQQYVGPFKILEKIGRLAYRLDLPAHWRIHPVLSVAQLEPAPSGPDPYQRPRPSHPDTVFVEGDTTRVKSYEIDSLINKRETARRGPEYLVRWKGYGPEYDEWRNIPELGNAMDLVKDYEQAMADTAFLPGRLELPSTPPRAAPMPTRRLELPSLTGTSTPAQIAPSAPLNWRLELPSKPPQKAAPAAIPVTTSIPNQRFAVIIPPRKTYPYSSTPFRPPNDKLGANEAVAR